jgi:POT family proton-dependent oligopeptide transporter
MTPTTAAFLFAVLPVVIYYLVLWARSAPDEKGPIGALLAIMGVVIVFWMVFHQNGNTLTLWARDYTNREAGVVSGPLEAVYMNEVAPESYWENVPQEEIPENRESVNLISTELFQSINPFFVVALTPLLVGFFALLRRRGREPSTPAKIAWGLLISAASTLLMVVAVRLTHGGDVKASAWWLVGTYGVITVGELFLSPMGLSLVSKLAPARVTSLMMGGWFVATAIGNKMAGFMGELWEKIPIEGIFWINGASALLAAGAIALMVPWIRRVMHRHEQLNSPEG